MEIGQKIALYMEENRWTLSRAPGTFNIRYGEGVKEDFTPNDDQIDHWNDRRLLLVYNPGKDAFEVVFNAAATTEPGKWYTQHPMVKAGAARIIFGQQTAWMMGFHGTGSMRHPALVQMAPVKVYRDSNKDGKRTGDRIMFAQGLNQHGAPTKTGIPPTLIGRHSAGCLVARDYLAHLAFIDLLKTDVRYVENKRFLFQTTVINGDLLHTWQVPA